MYKEEFLNGKVNLAYEYDAGITKSNVIIDTQDAKKKLLKIYLPSMGTVFHISRYAQNDKSSE